MYLCNTCNINDTILMYSCLIPIYRKKLESCQFHQAVKSSSVVPSSTSPEVPTGLEGGPTEGCRLRSSTRPMFVAMQLI